MNLNTWYAALHDCEQKGQGYVLVTVLGSAGSTPRDTGTKMVVTGDSQFDTIGGGNLEFQAVKQARAMLVAGKSTQEVKPFPLSSKLGQCCGGAVKLLFEVMVDHQQHIAIFGAGHVAQALVPILAQLPLQIFWIDSRENWLNPSNSGRANNLSSNAIAAAAQQIIQDHQNVRAVESDSPTDMIRELPSDTWIVIITHNHQLDYELVEASLKVSTSEYIGMIGSEKKAKRFKTRLAHRGFESQQIRRLISPIGDLTIQGKRPIEVAISISAQIMALTNIKTVNAQPKQTNDLEQFVMDEPASINTTSKNLKGNI